MGLAVLLLALNAFFVGAEFALVSARRTQIEPLAAAGSRVARTTLHAMERVSLMMAGAQLGITVCSLGLGAVAEPAVAHLIEPVMDDLGIPDGWLHPVAFVIAMSVVTFLHVVLGEMVPKNIALAGPERAALLLGPPMAVVVTILKPVVVGFNAIANGVLRLLRVEPRDEVASTFTREEVAGLLEQSHREGLLEEDEYDLLAAALGFTERTVDAVLLPLSQLATVPQEAQAIDVERMCLTTGFSRFPVTAADGDLVGYLHVKDVLGTEQPTDPIQRWVRPLVTVPEDARLHDALTALRSRGAHLARVVGHDGTVLGVVALEDVLEELVGEIRDAAHA
jgi:CBS domain containing-hemolysin-like protein